VEGQRLRESGKKKTTVGSINKMTSSEPKGYNQKTTENGDGNLEKSGKKGEDMREREKTTVSRH